MSDEEFFMLLVITVYLLQQYRQRSLQRTMAFVAEYIRIQKTEAESCRGLGPEILQKFSIMRPQIFIFRIILIYKSSKTSHFDNRSYSCIHAVDDSNCDSDDLLSQKNRRDKKADYQINHRG